MDYTITIRGRSEIFIKGVIIMKSLLLLLTLTLLTSCGFEIVDTGHRGVQTRFGEVDEKLGSLPEGLYFYNPLTSDIKEMNVQTQVANFTTASFTKDLQQVDVHFAINYQLEPNHAHTMFKEVGREYVDRIVNPIVAGSLKEIIGQFDAEDLISQRQKATKDILTMIKDKLLERHIIISNFEVTNLDFNDEFEKAIEAKVVAVQRAMESKNITERIREEKNQAILKAEGEAKAMKIKSQALTQNKNLIEYEAIQKWNGNLPKIMMGSGSIPFVNLGNITK